MPKFNKSFTASSPVPHLLWRCSLPWLLHARNQRTPDKLLQDRVGACSWPLTAAAKVASWPKPKRMASEGRTKPIQGVFPLTWGCAWVVHQLYWHCSFSKNLVSLWLFLLCACCEEALSTHINRLDNLSQCKAPNMLFTLQHCNKKIKSCFPQKHGMKPSYFHSRSRPPSTRLWRWHHPHATRGLLLEGRKGCSLSKGGAA